MASSGRPERVYHQDYIARIRYQNQLPPPPCPPKFLEIPNTGVVSGGYTSAKYATRLAREQPVNIEADAELGMPIDLVGLPGVFDGDESFIMAPEAPAHIDPRDKALLKPLSTLGKSNSLSTNVSFLRRMEYMTGTTNNGGYRPSDSAVLRTKQAGRKRRQVVDEKNKDPRTIYVECHKSIQKGFEIAYPEDAYRGPNSSQGIQAEPISQAEREAWERPRHPSKSNVKLLDSYPILPDLDACPDAGNFTVTKFHANPMPPSDKYDDRLEAGIFRILPPDPEAISKYQSQQAAAEADPDNVDPPLLAYDYEFFLPSTHDAVRGIKRKFSVTDPSADAEDLYDNVNEEGKRYFKFDRVRAYETYHQKGQPRDPHNGDIAIALHDPALDVGAVPGTKLRLQKAAYYYPVMQKTSIRPKRTNKKTPWQQREEDELKVDALEVEVRDANEEEMEKRRVFRANFEPDKAGLGALQEGALEG